jgi:hypothetical protein
VARIARQSVCRRRKGILEVCCRDGKTELPARPKPLAAAPRGLTSNLCPATASTAGQASSATRQTLNGFWLGTFRKTNGGVWRKNRPLRTLAERAGRVARAAAVSGSARPQRESLPPRSRPLPTTFAATSAAGFPHRFPHPAGWVRRMLAVGARGFEPRTSSLSVDPKTKGISPKLPSHRDILASESRFARRLIRLQFLSRNSGILESTNGAKRYWTAAAPSPDRPAGPRDQAPVPSADLLVPPAQIRLTCPKRLPYANGYVCAGPI